MAVESAALDATLADSTLTVTRAETTGASVQGRGAGTIVFGEKASTDFQYELARLDLAQVRALTGTDASGVISTTGRVSGMADALHAVGDATVNQLAAYGVQALTIVGRYDAVMTPSDLGRSKAQVNGRGTFLTLFGQSVQEASGTIALDADRLGFDLQLLQQEGRNGRIAGNVRLREDRHAAELVDLTMTLGRAPWRLTPAAQTPVVSWTDEGVSVTPLELTDGNNDERIGLSGTWRRDGDGALRITASHVFLDTLQSAFERPTRYGGVLDLDATLRGTAERPRVAATLTISNGRVERVSYQKLQGRVDYDAQMLRVDLRLDQAPGVWLTALGTVPASLFNRDLPDQPLDVTIKSSAINLGLVEGVTDVIRNVSGEVKLDVKAIGTSHDPHLDGSVDIANAAFLVTASGATYKNGRAAVKLAPDRMTVETLHVEDNGGHPLDVHGSLATHELRVGDLEIEARAQHFEVMRNEFGQVDVDATLQVRGQFESPRIAGNLTINSGNIKVDEILQRTLFQPYSTEPTPMSDVDAVAALNPWQRLGLDIELHVPNTLRLTGRDVQVSPGHADRPRRHQPAGRRRSVSLQGSGPAAVGDRIVRLGQRHLHVPGAAIRCRRGELHQLPRRSQPRDLRDRHAAHLGCRDARQHHRAAAATRAASVQHASARRLGHPVADRVQLGQQSAFVRAAAGAPRARGDARRRVHRDADTASHRESTRPRDPRDRDAGGIRRRAEGDHRPGDRARSGRALQPAVRQDPYDEATIEYYLSRILRLRATFSDAQTLTARSPFRRIERAGIDLLLFFSF